MSIAPSLRTRLAKLERAAALPSARPFAHLSDEQLEQRILRLRLGRDPSAEELHEWRSVPPIEAERRNRAMLAEVRRQLREL